MRPPVTYALLPLLVGLSLWDNNKEIFVVLVISTAILCCIGLLSIKKKKKYYAYKIGSAIVIGIILIVVSKQKKYQEVNDTLHKKESCLALYEMPPREIQLLVSVKKQKIVRRPSDDVYNIYTGIIVDAPIIRKDLLGKEIVWFSDAKRYNFLCNDIVQCFGVIQSMKNGKDNANVKNNKFVINITSIDVIRESDQFLSNIKRKIYFILAKEQWYNNETGSFVYAILMGNKSLLSTKSLDLFMKTGTMHLFAVSGLHVGIIYLLVSVILSRISSKRIIWIPATLLIVFCYVALVNFSPSACRAFTMISIWQIGLLLNKKRNPLSCLYLAALILLILDPKHFLSVGFQLSFTVVLNILFVMKNNKNRKELNIVSFFWSSFVISYTSFFGSLLLVIDNFHFINPISIVLNAILVNAIFFIFVVLLIQITYTIIFGQNFLISIIEIIYRLIDITINWFYEISFFHIHFSEKLDIPNEYHLVYLIVLMCIVPYIEKTWQKLIVVTVLPMSFLVIS